jgi:phage tail sheath gpL-like
LAIDSGVFGFRNAIAVTPSDTADLVNQARALWIGAGGNVTVNMAQTGASITFTAVPAGTLLLGNINRVLATGTTAASLVALW